jgi:hypothetical protein
MKNVLTLLGLFLSLSAFSSIHSERIDRASNGNRKAHFRIDKNNTIHMVYTGCTDQACKNNELMYATKTPAGTWNIKSLDKRNKNTGLHASIELAPNGTIYIAYNNHSKRELHLMTRPQGESKFDHQVLEKNAGFWITTAFSDRLHIANTTFPLGNGNWTGGFTFWNYNSSRSYQRFTDHTFEAGWFNSLTLDQNKKPVFTYLSKGYFMGNLMVGTIKNNKIEVEVLEIKALKSSIAVDKEGRWHVVYQKVREDDAGYSIDSHDLIYAVKGKNGKWTKTTLEEGGDEFKLDTGLHPNILIDREEKIHVTYRNFLYKTLRYMRKDKNGWSEMQELERGGLYSFMQETKDNKLLITHDTGDTIRMITMDN